MFKPTNEQIKNREDFKNTIKETVEKLDQVFKSDSNGFNSQGGIGWELIKENLDNTFDEIYILFKEDERDIDIHDFNIDKKEEYVLFIQVQVKDSQEVDNFNTVEEAIEYYKNNTN